METMEKTFYRCSVCGNLVGVIKNGGGTLVCCGKPMEKLVPNHTDAAKEKHVPVYKKENGKIYVTVGSVEHPMTKEHLIEWIAVVGDGITQRVSLKPGDAPKAEFMDVKNATVYAYCNLHGLWSAEVSD